MQKNKHMLTVERLTKKLATLEKRIERHKQQTIRPFIKLIMQAQRNGKLELMLAACKLIATKQAVRTETEIEPQPL
ncbi:MAG: hypothetical protein HXX11_21795 [Desulfuromonadales bacterium]|nr:hypothetical protein [Desulfuromonadales bacterium]